MKLKRKLMIATLIGTCLTLNACGKETLPEAYSEKAIINENLLNVVKYPNEQYLLDDVYYAINKTFRDSGIYNKNFSDDDYEALKNKADQFNLNLVLDKYDIKAPKLANFTVQDIYDKLDENIIILKASLDENPDRHLSTYLVYGIEKCGKTDALFYEQYIDGIESLGIGSLNTIKSDLVELGFDEDLIKFDLYVINNKELKEPYKIFDCDRPDLKEVFEDKNVNSFNKYYNLAFTNDEENQVVCSDEYYKYHTKQDSQFYNLNSFLDAYGIDYEYLAFSEENLQANLKNNLVISVVKQNVADVIEPISVYVGANTKFDGQYYDYYYITKLPYPYLMDEMQTGSLDDSLYYNYNGIDWGELKLLVIKPSELENVKKVKEVKIPNYIQAESKVKNTTNDTYEAHKSKGVEDMSPCTKVQALYMYNYLHPDKQLNFLTEVKKHDWFQKSLWYEDFIEAGYFNAQDIKELINVSYWDFMKALEDGNLISVCINFEPMKKYYTKNSNDHDGIGYDGHEYSWLVDGLREDAYMSHQITCYGYKMIKDEPWFMFYDAYDYKPFILPIKAFMDGTIYQNAWTLKVNDDAKVYYQK